MANFHKNANSFINDLTFSENSIIVEIGSDRNEGSTEWFDQIAKEKNIEFYSIDVIDFAFKNLIHLKNTNFVIAKSGSGWANNDLKNIDKKIKILYLDNYDWISCMDNISASEQDLIEDYRKRDVVMSNLDCQREHLCQMIGCLPYMDDESLIICDDTPYNSSSGVYFGKNGAVVPYLLNYDYEIVFGKGFNRQCHEDNGVILHRKIK